MADLYRARPLVVAAMGPLTRDNLTSVQAWCGGTVATRRGEPVGVIVSTRKGLMLAEFGDFVVTGGAGAFHPCTPDVFSAVYEPAEEPTDVDAPLNATSECGDLNVPVGAVLAMTGHHASRIVDDQREINRLRADRARWRRIADEFAEAGTHETAHSAVLDDYEAAVNAYDQGDNQP